MPLSRRLRRPTIAVETLLLAGVLYLLAACNAPFWHAALAGLSWAAASTAGYFVHRPSPGVRPGR